LMVEGSIDEIIIASMGPEIQGYTMGEPILEREGSARLAELDILMTPEEYEEYIAMQNGTLTRRKAVDYEHRRWTDATMPWTSTWDGFDSYDKENVLEAMRLWSKHTCMKFREVSYNDNAYKISIENGRGCNSYVGMIRRHAQTLNLGNGCKSVGTALHELGHAIGLNHEQCRADRDPYLWVRFDQINPKYHFASRKRDNINNFGVPYDYASIMHYGQGAFAIDRNEPSMVTTDPSWQHRIGKARSLSFGDIKTVNLMYKCAEKANCGSKSCPEDGFLDKNCQCICRGNPTRPCDTAKQPDNQWTCENDRDTCDDWANKGYCNTESRYHGFMKKNCMKSCGVCGPNCADFQDDCLDKAKKGMCKKDAGYMLGTCFKSCGTCYLTGKETRCKDLDANCSELAAAGRCVTDKENMKRKCARSCASNC